MQVRVIDFLQLSLVFSQVDDTQRLEILNEAGYFLSTEVALAKKLMQVLLNLSSIELMLIFIDFFQLEICLGSGVHVRKLSSLREMLFLGVEVCAGFEELKRVRRS